MKFPHYRYDDMVRAQNLLVRDGLKVDHLRLVMGTSQGGMHTWLWGVTYPDFMDALMPLARRSVSDESALAVHAALAGVGIGHYSRRLR